MKKFLFLLMLALLVTGCFKRDSLEDINIYTTAYPFRYVTEMLYGEHSEVYSIYPAQIDINDYTLTDKQIEIYGKDSSLYIFNGLNKEADYVIPMVKHNKNLKIINATLTMDYEYSHNDLWLNPSNLLMIAQNIKNGLNEYITANYLEEQINANYETLKINLSNLDAKIRLISNNADNKKLITSSEEFRFLEKYYKFEVLVVNENSEQSTINEAKELIENKKVSYVFLFKDEEINTQLASLMSNTDLKAVYFHPLDNLSEDEEKNKLDYLSIMNENIELIKEEVYNKKVTN